VLTLITETIVVDTVAVGAMTVDVSAVDGVTVETAATCTRLVGVLQVGDFVLSGAGIH